MGIRQHKKSAPLKLSVAVITVSTTRTAATDKSGQWIGKLVKKEGHDLVFQRVVGDDAAAIRATVLECINEYASQAIILTGGSGISPQDVTIESVQPLFEKELTAFGTLFAQLSFEEIDAAAMLSRATAGVIGRSVVFCIPGSLKACKLACKHLIFPELTHVVKHILER